MESRLKHRIFVFSLLAWTVIPSKEDDLFLLLIKGLIQSFTVAYFLAL